MEKDGLRAVIFVISCQNYFGYHGIRLNNEAYSSFPEENEILLRDGFEVYVLTVKEDQRFKTTHQKLKKYDGLVFDIIHLFHDG